VTPLSKPSPPDFDLGLQAVLHLSLLPNAR
jgi:hypothetical protein